VIALKSALLFANVPFTYEYAEFLLQLSADLATISLSIYQINKVPIAWLKPRSSGAYDMDAAY
jgi:hypothetical protein